MPIRKPIPWHLPRQDACTCGCGQHDQRRYEAMRQAQADFARKLEEHLRPITDVEAFLKGAAVAQRDSHPTGPQRECDCTICVNVRGVQEAALRLSYALSASAYQALTEAGHKRLMDEAHRWKHWAESLSSRHQKKGGA